MDKPGRFDEEPIGWKIVSIGYDGSVLCESPQGHRRRYVFDGPAPEVSDPKAIVITAKASTDAHSCGTCLHWRSWKNVPVYIEAGIGTCHHPDGDKAAALRTFCCPFWEGRDLFPNDHNFNPTGAGDGRPTANRKG